MTDNQAQAKAFAIALYEGFTSPERVIEWVDALLQGQDQPDENLIEASLSKSRVNDLITSLNLFAGSPQVQPVARAVIAEMRDLFASDSSTGPRIARALYAMFLAGDVPQTEAKAGMASLDDAYEFAKLGGDFSETSNVDRELADFLHAYGQPAT